jgi:murein DD-endopeptidase MepM/ murein hydrolase activator NlpD
MTISNQKLIIIILSFLFIFFPTLTNAKSDMSGCAAFEMLKTLDLQDETIKLIRKDIRNSIVIIKKGGDASSLPELTFYRYRVKGSDNFWKILSKASLNIDTLSTINAFSSPADASIGKEIYISNMRGIVHKVNLNETMKEVSGKYGIAAEYIRKVNKITDDKITKEFIFVPSGEISNIERSLFLGVGFASPLKNSRRTSSFGRRLDPFNKRLEFHSGLDLACPVGSDVYASRKGKVEFAGNYGGYGLLVIIKHEHGYSTYYGHLKKVLIKEGDAVERGSLLALSGESGRSTGPHLHFEVRKETRPINPGILL